MHKFDKVSDMWSTLLGFLIPIVFIPAGLVFLLVLEILYIMPPCCKQRPSIMSDRKTPKTIKPVSDTIKKNRKSENRYASCKIFGIRPKTFRVPRALHNPAKAKLKGDRTILVETPALRRWNLAAKQLFHSLGCFNVKELHDFPCRVLPRKLPCSGDCIIFSLA